MRASSNQSKQLLLKLKQIREHRLFFPLINLSAVLFACFALCQIDWSGQDQLPQANKAILEAAIKENRLSAEKNDRAWERHLDLQPIIQVEGNGQIIQSSPTSIGRTDFGKVRTPICKIFVIRNVGHTNLQLTTPDLIRISGQDTAEFAIVSTPSSSVGAKNSTTFSIRLNPITIGPKQATISIPNNDPQQKDFSFNLLAQVISLPVNWVYVEANPIEQIVEINWGLIPKGDPRGYRIERSQDGQQFEVIGQVSAADNESQVADFRFTDQRPHHGINLYRIKQLSSQGSADTSGNVSVYFAPSAQELIVFPNPNQGTLYLDEVNNGQVRVLNLSGKEVKRVDIHNDLLIDLRDLLDGTYYLQMIDKEGQEKIAHILLKR
ncbi:MAG: choice-of-anchor D domain-containing protein [Bacteroidota bacterium]